MESLRSWESAWLNKGVSATILVGEWGYCLKKEVTDATQEAVIKAEVTNAFPTIPYLAGTNYWVGPGSASYGTYANIFTQNLSGAWSLRPAANDVSAFYAAMNGAR